MRVSNSQGNDGFCTEDGCKLKALPGKDTCANHMTADVVPAVPKKPAKVRDLAEDEEYERYDPVVEANRIAQRLIAQEEAERVRFWQEQANRSPEARRKKRAPMRMSAKRPRWDMTKIDPALIKPGYSKRWVRETDDSGNPSDARMEQFQEFGYEVIHTPDGKPLRSIFGVAMQAPIRDAAERIAVNMPTGALHRDALLADAQEMVDETNKRSRSGYAAGLVKERGHGRQRDGDDSD